MLHRDLCVIGYSVKKLIDYGLRKNSVSTNLLVIKLLCTRCTSFAPVVPASLHVTRYEKCL